MCKVEKVRSTFHTFHDYLNFYGEKKDDRLFTIYSRTLLITKKAALTTGLSLFKTREKSGEKFHLICEQNPICLNCICVTGWIDFLLLFQWLEIFIQESHCFIFRLVYFFYKRLIFQQTCCQIHHNRSLLRSSLCRKIVIINMVSNIPDSL